MNSIQVDRLIKKARDKYEDLEKQVDFSLSLEELTAIYQPYKQARGHAFNAIKFADEEQTKSINALPFKTNPWWVNT